MKNQQIKLLICQWELQIYSRKSIMNTKVSTAQNRPTKVTGQIQVKVPKWPARKARAACITRTWAIRQQLSNQLKKLLVAQVRPWRFLRLIIQGHRVSSILKGFIHFKNHQLWAALKVKHRSPILFRESTQPSSLDQMQTQITRQIELLTNFRALVLTTMGVPFQKWDKDCLKKSLKR